MKNINFRGKLLCKINKLKNIFITREMINEPIHKFLMDKKQKDEHKLAVNTYKKIYAHFNTGESIRHSQIKLNCLGSITDNDFIFEVIGEIRYFDMSNFLSRIFFDPVKSIAWNLYKYISKPENVIKMYEQAVQDNKIVIRLGRHGYFSCDQTLYADNKVFLRFKGNNRSFWLIQHFMFYSIYFPNERIYFSLRNHINHRKHRKCIRNFHLVLFEFLGQLMRQDEEDAQAFFSGLLLSYRRPFHFFSDMLPTADLVLSSSPVIKNNLKKFITLTGRCFFTPQNFFGAHYSSMKFDHENLNQYLIKHRAFVLQPVKNIRNDFNNFTIGKNFYGKIVSRSNELANQDDCFSKILTQAKLATPLFWFGACDERRSWAEGTESICKIVKHLKKIYPNIGLVIDGITAPENVDHFQPESIQKEENTCAKIAAQLPEVSIINAVGLRSYQKIALAKEVDFFLTCFLTDSLYVAQFNSKPGLGYGTRTADVTGHRHPMTVILPKTKVANIAVRNPRTPDQTGRSYSIDPDEMALTTFKVFEYYQLLKSKENIHKLFSGRGFKLEKNTENNSIKLTSTLPKSHDVCVGEQTYVSSRHCSSSTYPIRGSKNYLFRFEAFAKKESALYIFAYANGENIFKSLSFEAGRARTIIFPAQASTFRLFIDLKGHDELEFFDIHWNTDEIVGSVRLGGDLDLPIKARGGNDSA